MPLAPRVRRDSPDPHRPGPAQKYSADADDYRPNDAKLRAQGEVNELYVGQELAAWDAASGAELWRFAEPRIDPAKLVAAGGRVYLYAKFWAS